MKHSVMLASLTLVMLSGCNKPAQTEAPAAPAAENTAMPAEPAPRVTYSCEPPMTLTVVYDNSVGDGRAVVTLEGKEFMLDHVQSGSGARYLGTDGRSEGKSLIWWNKGDEGLLLEGSATDPGQPEITIATCKQQG